MLWENGARLTYLFTDNENSQTRNVWMMDICITNRLRILLEVNNFFLLVWYFFYLTGIISTKNFIPQVAKHFLKYKRKASSFTPYKVGGGCGRVCGILITFC